MTVTLTPSTTTACGRPGVTSNRIRTARSVWKCFPFQSQFNRTAVTLVVSKLVVRLAGAPIRELNAKFKNDSIAMTLYVFVFALFLSDLFSFFPVDISPARFALEP